MRITPPDTTPILFLGSSPFGLPTLERLYDAGRVVGVVTQPDRPAGRKRRLSPTPVGAWAGAHAPDLPIFKHENVNDPGALAALRAIDAPSWVVIAFGQKLSAPLLDGRFAINLHASLLPRWRGAAPIHAAVIAGDARTGNCVITLAERMDAGLVLRRTAIDIAPRDTTAEVHSRLAELGADDIHAVLDAHATGTLTPETQDESLVTRAKKLSRADCWVDFTASAFATSRRINGLSPSPGVALTITTQEGDAHIKAIRSEPAERTTDNKPGVIIDTDQGLIDCADGALRLLDVQPPGKTPMPWHDFARSRHITTGSTVRSDIPPPPSAST